MKALIYPLRFSESDRKYYDAGVAYAKTKRSSLAELLRQLLIDELTRAGQLPEDKPS